MYKSNKYRETLLNQAFVFELCEQYKLILLVEKINIEFESIFTPPIL